MASIMPKSPRIAQLKCGQTMLRERRLEAEEVIRRRYGSGRQRRKPYLVLAVPGAWLVLAAERIREEPS